MTIFTNRDPTLFTAHHVGGRSGSVLFPDLPKFSEDIYHVIYDADVSCLAQIEEIWKGKNVTVLPYCLADKCGTAKFHINYCPYTSSLFPMNKNFGNFYEKKGKYDYVYEYVLKTEKVINVETLTLDSLVETGVVSPPDFLSIDTQGAELLILMGSVQSLNKNTVAVSVEINFAPIYEGAPLFGKLDEFLRSNGFLLAEIKPFNNCGYKRIPEPFRGKGIHIEGEALYLLRPNAVTGSDERALSIRLDKLAFAACAFGYTEFALEALDLSVSVLPNNDRQRMYQKFIYELLDEMGKHTQMPPLWHEMYSFAESTNRFVAVRRKTFSRRAVSMLLSDPLDFLQKIAKWTVLKIKSYAKKLPIQISVLPKRTTFESFLINNGFHLAAQRVRERRRSEI
jgi:FkbM family methyltransferase